MVEIDEFVLLVLDRHERPDRCVRPGLGCGAEWELDAAEALRCSERTASEGVQSFAAVEVADPADSGVVVTGSVGVGATHPADGDVFEDRPGAERCRCGRHAGVPRGREYGAAVVRKSQQLRDVSTDADEAGSRRVRRAPATASLSSACHTWGPAIPSTARWCSS